MRKTGKVISKYYRLQLTDGLRELVQKLPISGLEETQVGDHVYSAAGTITVGGRQFPATVRVRLVSGAPRVYIRSSEAGIAVTCPFEAEAAGKAVEAAIARSLN